jgi:hypothetical protein
VNETWLGKRTAIGENGSISCLNILFGVVKFLCRFNNNDEDVVRFQWFDVSVADFFVSQHEND